MLEWGGRDRSHVYWRSGGIASAIQESCLPCLFGHQGRHSCWLVYIRHKKKREESITGELLHKCNRVNSHLQLRYLPKNAVLELLFTMVISHSLLPASSNSSVGTIRGFSPKLASLEIGVGGLAYLKAPDTSIIPEESFQFFKPARRLPAILCLPVIPYTVVCSPHTSE